MNGGALTNRNYLGIFEYQNRSKNNKAVDS